MQWWLIKLSHCIKLSHVFCLIAFASVSSPFFSTVFSAVSSISSFAVSSAVTSTVNITDSVFAVPTVPTMASKVKVSKR